MATIDLRPMVADIKGYVGDTITIKVIVDAAFVAGRDWTAHIRSSRSNMAIDATFIVTVIPEGASLTLPADESRRLAGAGFTARGVSARSAPLQRYAGVWDVQISVKGKDPVTTLAQGDFTLDADVTRLP